MTDKNYRGANVLYRYDDGNEDKWFHGYISFGTWDCEKRVDSFGVPDDNIFFYSTLDELVKVLTIPDNGADFHVKSIELVRADYV